MNFKLKIYKSIIGDIYLVAKDTLCGLYFAKNWEQTKKSFQNLCIEDNEILINTAIQLNEYFNGHRKNFDIKLSLNGTEFQKKVWSALATIPFGITITYKDQAELINSPKAYRAVGRTNGFNPISIILPCHRVIGSNNRLTGYVGGLEVKKYLLELENGNYST
jgi:methylated-DNA-[protein]-cysteine S-methyltransferase